MLLKYKSNPLKRDYPPMFINNSHEHEVSSVVDNQDGVTGDSVWRIEPVSTTYKIIKTRFHTFTLDNIKVLAMP